MKTVTFYPQQNQIIYALNNVKSSEQGKIQNADVENFLSQKKPGILNIVLPKQELIFRRMEFPFSGKRKIQLVLSSELENLLLESPDNYLYTFEFFSDGKNRTIVNIYAIRVSTYNFWKNLAKNNNAKLFLFSDALLFNNLLRQKKDKGSNHIAIYAIDDYLLINITENGMPSGFYCYDSRIAQSTDVGELIKDVLSRRDFHIYVAAEERLKKEFLPQGITVHDISVFPETENQFLFHNLCASKNYRNPLRLRKLSRAKEIPSYSIILLGIFLIVSAISFVIYLQRIEKERQIDGLIAEMSKMFSTTFPEVKKIVDPLVQAKEKVIQGIDTLSITYGHPSVLKTMAEVTSLFPEKIDAQIDQFSISEKTLTISGTVNSLKSLETVRNNIEKSRDFTIIDMGTISFDERNRPNFNITIGLL